MLRSLNGETFEPVGSISSNTTGRYIYTDASFTGGTCYYRIAERDQDGNTWLTHTLSTEGSCGIAPDRSPLLFPNPAMDVLSLELFGEASGQVQIFAPDGRLVMQFQAGGNEVNTLDISGLLPGVYMLKVVQDGAVTVQRFVKS